MKKVKSAIIALILSSLVLGILSCGSEAKPTTPAGNQVKVQRGSLIVDVLTSGNLQFSKEEELSFDLPVSATGNEGITIDNVTVDVGDSVEKGDVLATLDQSDWDDKLKDLKLSVMEAESNLKSAQISAEQASYPEYTQAEIELKELQVEQAKARLEDAQENLSEFKATSQHIEAPFSGVIIAVNIEAGEEVTNEIAIKIADPNEFEIDVSVNEMDIPKLSEGSPASIKVDALSGLMLSGEVTYISPTAAISSGVVTYKATVKVTSVKTVTQPLQVPSQGAMGDTTQQGKFPEGMPQPPNSSNRTTMEQGKPPTMSGEPPTMSGQAQTGNRTAQEQSNQSSTDSSQLKEGLSVTVTIILQQRNNVLLVPAGAITTEGTRSYVQVVTSSGEGEEVEIETEKRTIQTGISDGNYTVVTEGLSEGETVLVPEATFEQGTGGGPPGGMIIPGGGPPH